MYSATFDVSFWKRRRQSDCRNEIELSVFLSPSSRRRTQEKIELLGRLSRENLLSYLEMERELKDINDMQAELAELEARGTRLSPGSGQAASRLLRQVQETIDSYMRHQDVFYDTCRKVEEAVDEPYVPPWQHSRDSVTEPPYSAVSTPRRQHVPVCPAHGAGT